MIMASSKLSIERQIIEEHAELNRNIGELKMTIMEKVLTKDFPDWRVQFVGRLRDLKQKLSKHFEFEEQGGFMKELADEAPQCLGYVKELEVDHRKILADLDGVLTDIRALNVQDDHKLQNIFDRLSGIMKTLHHHEITEDELLQDTFSKEP